MTHDRFDKLIEGICYAYDYGSDSHMKAIELRERLRPLGSQVEPQTGLEALYGIIAVSLELTKELECMSAITVEEVSQQAEELNHMKEVAQ